MIGDELDEPREWTEAEYVAGERTSDRMLGLWFGVIVGSAALGALVSWILGVDVGIASLLVMGPCIGGFLFWASKRTHDLPPQREAIRWKWLLKVGVVYPVLGVVAAFVVFGVLAALGVSFRD